MPHENVNGPLVKADWANGKLTNSLTRIFAKLFQPHGIVLKLFHLITELQLMRPVFRALQKLYTFFCPILSCECHSNSRSGGLTEDGFERSLQRNYLAQILLVRSLSRVIACRERVTRSERVRIIVLSGDSHRYAPRNSADASEVFGHVPSRLSARLDRYALSKLFQLGYLSELLQRLRDFNRRIPNAAQLPLVCACNTESILAYRCCGRWWQSLDDILQDPVLFFLRLAHFLLTAFLQSPPCGIPHKILRYPIQITIMDPSLLKEREAFLKRAKALPSVEKPRAVTPVSSEASPNVLRRSVSSAASDFRSLELRPQLQGKFAVLSRIVKYMKHRHLERDMHPLTVEEILEEAMLHDTPQSTIRWLEEEALPNNPKIRVTPDGKFVFKPRYDIRTRQDLYQLLKRHELKGLGGIYMDDIAECIPDAEKVINGFGDHVIRIVTPHDKKTILFYNDKSFDLNVDEEFKQQWRAVSVEGIHESKIEEYLMRNGILSMSGDRKRFIPAQRKKPGQRRTVSRPVKLKDNEHVGYIIEDFSEKLKDK
ncbi:hypothetical protein P879_07095 [Paragonimus westermani]|uniref:TFIIE beta domain-containing protein n=1 Tax=Paragonimus westermani TaxID=34504 RepID=A0A8T0DME3_9TREM|nr:hypothetical protein P879_07095 [Paragonimus westermani]